MLVAFLWIGYLLHFVPFFFMQRQLFLHHYLPAHYFMILAFAGMLGNPSRTPLDRMCIFVKVFDGGCLYMTAFFFFFAEPLPTRMPTLILLVFLYNSLFRKLCFSWHLLFILHLHQHIYTPVYQCDL